MSRTISKCRRYGNTIFNSAIHPYDSFSETGRWRTNNLRYQFRRNKTIPRNSDCPIKTISTRGKFTIMYAIKAYYESTMLLFPMSSGDDIDQY